MFSFRVPDMRIARLLFAMLESSDFIRQAVTEKFWVDLDGDLQTSPQDKVEQSADSSISGENKRLRDGLIAIEQSSVAILHAGDDGVPDLVCIGLIGIGEAAAILAAGQPGGEDAEQPTDGATEPGADVSATGRPPDPLIENHPDQEDQT